MNRRTQGRVKQARKRLQKRIDIRAGRRMSMQQFIHNTHHHEEEVVEAPVLEAPVLEQVELVDPNATHMLVRKDVSLADGAIVEAELQRGSEREMRKQRAISMEADPEGTFSVRKIKVAVA